MRTLGLSLALAAAALAEAAAQQIVHPPGAPPHRRPWAAYVIAPQARPVASPSPGAVEITGVDVSVDIVEQVATTTMDVALSNPGSRRMEAEMLISVPDGVAIRGFSFQGAGASPSAELLTREEARRIYDSIVAQTRDPALLEFAGLNVIRSSVFPVEPRGTQEVRLVYEQLLESDGDRVDYTLPRTESVSYRVPWTIRARLRAKSGVGAVYSPTHEVTTQRAGDGSATVRTVASAATEPGPFRLSFLLQREKMAASLLAYPDPKFGGGYFLLLAGAPGRVEDRRFEEREVQKREVILVLDRSGSMAGEKMEQVRNAALQVLEGLDDGEAFNVIVYHEAVESFAPRPVLKSPEMMREVRDYLRRIRVRGGTNIHDALREALEMDATDGFLPMVLFLTDGLPTVGQTSERAIRKLAVSSNRHHRRVFTFGVGADVNTPLLDKVAVGSRAASTFVLPGEDVEVKVGQVFKRLSGPVLAAPTLSVAGEDGEPARGRVSDLLPSELPDLFSGDSLILLGQYAGDAPLRFELQGEFFGKPKTFEFKFDLGRADRCNAFVPRLWASRKIAVLTDAIRDLGADLDRPGASDAATDPRLNELVQEIVRLSKEFGILTEYTAFLAREGAALDQPAAVFREARKNFDERALKTRFGLGAVSQSFNNSDLRNQAQLKRRNDFFDAELNRVEISTVQQVNDRAFYKRGRRWIDSALLQQTNVPSPRVIEIGSDEFKRLASKLADQNRQGTVALDGEILMQVDGETLLIR